MDTTLSSESSKPTTKLDGLSSTSITSDSNTMDTETIIDDAINTSLPQFRERLYSVRVREGFPVGTLVMRIKAFDADHDLAGRIHYYIRRENEDGKFFIDEDMGNIRFKRPLDFEKRPFYNLTVVTKDEGQPSLSSITNLVIEIEDVEENSSRIARECSKVSRCVRNRPCKRKLS